MIGLIKNLFNNKEVLVFILGMMPVSELRGAIPAGLAMGLPLKNVLLLAIAGNLVPVIPMLLLFEPVSARIRKLRLFKKFFDWFFERTRKKADLIEKYEVLGLAIFVGIPLPITGAWTGCVAATMFKIKFKYALPAIIAGIITAALIVTAACLFGKGAWITVQKFS